MAKSKSSPERLFIGLMSGTSVDSIDAALVRITGPTPRYGVQVLHHRETKWPAALRRRILALMAPAETTTEELCRVNFLVAQQFALATGRLLAAARTPAGKIAALGAHGQTICHIPPRDKKSGPGSTLQIGDPSVLATLSGIRTVGNFRPADMAAGGQGAPLVPWTDAALLTHKSHSRAIQNIGGIANVTYLPPSGQGPVIAFDTGPGNVLMDTVITLATSGKQTFDRNGRLAAQGALNQRLFDALRAHPHFERLPPKSTGREEFGRHLAEQIIALMASQKLGLPDVLHTVTRLTAWSIIDGYVSYLPEIPREIILCGGGASNRTLVQMLADQCSLLKHEPGPPIIRRIDELGIPNKSKEAASFALLAAATLDGIPGNLPSVTGASRPAMLGVIANPHARKL